MRTHSHFLHDIEMQVRGKEIKNISEKMNEACHFGHACHRFGATLSSILFSLLAVRRKLYKQNITPLGNLYIKQFEKKQLNILLLKQK